MSLLSHGYAFICTYLRAPSPSASPLLLTTSEPTPLESHLPAASLHSFSCLSHCPTPPWISPPLAASAQALCCTAQLRCKAAPALTNVSSLTRNGRSPELWMTGGGRPPMAPVNVCTLLPEVDDDDAASSSSLSPIFFSASSGFAAEDDEEDAVAEAVDVGTSQVAFPVPSTTAFASSPAVSVVPDPSSPPPAPRNAALKASAAACPFFPAASPFPFSHAAAASLPALHLSVSCWQMKPLMTPMFNALP